MKAGSVLMRGSCDNDGVWESRKSGIGQASTHAYHLDDNCIELGRSTSVFTITCLHLWKESVVHSA